MDHGGLGPGPCLMVPPPGEGEKGQASGGQKGRWLKKSSWMTPPLLPPFEILDLKELNWGDPPTQCSAVGPRKGPGWGGRREQAPVPRGPWRGFGRLTEGNFS